MFLLSLKILCPSDFDRFINFYTGIYILCQKAYNLHEKSTTHFILLTYIRRL